MYFSVPKAHSILFVSSCLYEVVSQKTVEFGGCKERQQVGNI